MADAPIDRVLSCPNLPSLPAAAVRILEQTRDPEVTLEQIARTIQTDPALATKVLRTVNSSLYGLSRPCSTIGRAISYLGLNTVKSVVLGFSLVDSARRAADGGRFDLEAYWRRAVYAAASARLIAEAARGLDKDEAFVAALVQDIGMLAAFAALRQTYTGVLDRCAGGHERLPDAEREALGFTHPEAGALLARKWRLPEHIGAAIQWHHDPDGAPGEHLALVRAVALGNALAGVLDAGNRVSQVRHAAALAERWFALDRESIPALVEKTAERGGDLARAMEVRTGAPPDIEAILGEANEALLAHQVELEKQTATLRQATEDLARQTLTDALTGAFNRRRFDAELERLFAEASRARSSLGVLFVDADKFKSVNDAHGHKAGDAVLIELVARMRRIVGGAGSVCRYGGEEFAVFLPGSDAATSARVAERIRQSMVCDPVDLSGTGSRLPTVTVTVSVGVSALERGEGFGSAADLVKAADDAVYLAKRAGRNRVRLHGHAEPGPEAPRDFTRRGPTVMLVDDDPLAKHLMEILLVKRKGATVVNADSAEQAIQMMEAPGAARPDLIVSDARLPGMNGEAFVREVARRRALAGIPVVVLSAAADSGTSAACLAAGARAFVLKAEMARDMDGWTTRLLSYAVPRRSPAETTEAA